MRHLHPYTQILRAASPIPIRRPATELGAVERRNPVSLQSAVWLANFHPRCPLRGPICAARNAENPTEPVTGRQVACHLPTIPAQQHANCAANTTPGGKGSCFP